MLLPECSGDLEYDLAQCTPERYWGSHVSGLVIYEFTSFLNRSKGQCGIQKENGIHVEVFRNGHTKIKFFPEWYTEEHSFSVEHKITHGATPR